MIEHFDIVFTLISTFVTILAGWFAMKYKSEQNSKEILDLTEEVSEEIKKHKQITDVLFKRVDEQREQIFQIKIQNSNFATKEHVVSRHYTKDEIDQYLKNMENNHKEDRILLNKIYDNLLNMSKSDK